MKELIDNFVKAITPDYNKGPIAGLVIDKEAEIEFRDGIWKYKIKKPMKEKIKDLCKSWTDEDLEQFLGNCIKQSKWLDDRDIVALIQEKQERSPKLYSEEEE